MGFWTSTIIGTIILLLTGLFVSFFIGEDIIISGIQEEKRIDELTEEVPAFTVPGTTRVVAVELATTTAVGVIDAFTVELPEN